MLSLTLRPFFASIVFALLLMSPSALAQTTAFTYQGKLNDNNIPANGTYDVQFKLFDAASGGTQQGSTLTLTNITVTNGLFTVQLDFGACPTCFTGAARFLDISVRPSGGGAFTQLVPRQPVTATPYAIKTQHLTFNGPNFNFTASNTFTGEGAGLNTTPDPDPSGINGKLNAFYGAGAGMANTNGQLNSFFGAQAGQSNTGGSSNAFFGHGAGFSNTTGGANAFFGLQAGAKNSTRSRNTFIGFGADFDSIDPTGSLNNLLGFATIVTSGVSNGTAIGAFASVTQSNSLILGSINGVNNCLPISNCDSVNVGIGTTAPAARLHISGTGGIRARINSDFNAGLALTLNNQPGWSVATVTGGQFQS